MAFQPATATQGVNGTEGRLGTNIEKVKKYQY